MASIKIDISGDKELIRDLNTLEKRTYTKSVLNQAMKQAIKPILMEARRNAKNITNKDFSNFKGSKLLVKAIKTKVSKGKKPGVWLGPDYGVMPTAHWWETGTNPRDNTKSGHVGRIKPEWYLLKAYKSKRSEAIRAIRLEIMKALDKKKVKLGLEGNSYNNYI